MIIAIDFGCFRAWQMELLDFFAKTAAAQRQPLLVIIDILRPLAKLLKGEDILLNIKETNTSRH